jgi:hypothetical protein
VNVPLGSFKVRELLDWGSFPSFCDEPSSRPIAESKSLSLRSLLELTLDDLASDTKLIEVI